MEVEYQVLPTSMMHWRCRNCAGVATCLLDDCVMVLESVTALYSYINRTLPSMRLIASKFSLSYSFMWMRSNVKALGQLALSLRRDLIGGCLMVHIRMAASFLQSQLAIACLNLYHRQQIVSIVSTDEAAANEHLSGHTLVLFATRR
jgi:hypothetical protein